MRVTPLSPRLGAPLSTLTVLAATLLLWCLAPPALALPEGRIYEMVSPVYKAGYGVNEIVAAAPNGESLAFSAKGGFGGLLSGSGFFNNVYVARRGTSEWSTESVQPPFGSVSDFSSDLEYTLASAPVGPNAGAENFSATEQELLLHHNDTPEASQNWQLDGGLVLTNIAEGPATGYEQGASANLCHVVMGAYEGPLLPAARGTNGQIYDVAEGCEGEPPSLRLVALKNNDPATVINQKCGAVELGIGTAFAGSGEAAEQEDQFNAVAAGGEELFFTTGLKSQGCVVGYRGGEGLQLFVRLDGVRTLEVSRPLSPACSEVPCEGAASRANAYFKGASEDGSRVFFTTTEPPIPGDTDESSNLYLAIIGCPTGQPKCQAAEKVVTSLIQVSHDPTSGEAAEAQGVVRVAPDGSRVYFVARGVLSGAPNAEGQAPVEGADNLYVYESDPEHEGRFKTVFIADLCSGPALSGVVEDVSCPRDLEEGGSDGARNDIQAVWGSGDEAQTAGQDGEFLIFSTYAQLLAGDTDNAKDIYRYDAETGSLERISVGEGGYDANGNCEDQLTAVADRLEEIKCDATLPPLEHSNDYVTTQQEMATRAVSEDGSRIVFASAEPLSPDAANGYTNIYEWHEGNVSLVSSGSAEEVEGSGKSEGDGRHFAISPAGRDIFFQTIEGLVPQDTDGLSDIYDARLEGGFPSPPAPREPCSGDACQGPLTNPAPLLVPGSVSQAAGENIPVQAATKAKAKAKAKAKSKKKKNKKTKKKSGSRQAVKSFGRSGR